MSCRSRLLLVIAALGLAAALATIAIAQSANEDDLANADVRTLAAEVRTLRERVRRIEDRLAQRDGRTSVSVIEPGRQYVDQAAPQPPMTGRQPQGYVNGAPYYVIPLQGQQAENSPKIDVAPSR